MIRYRKGDLIKLAKQGEFDIIAHGCNCFCTMNSGIARQIKQVFPGSFKADLRTNRADRSKLGQTTSYYDTLDDVVIINMYTQYNYGRDPDTQYVDYTAVRSCMKHLKAYADSCINNTPRIGLPKIGAGLANGDWKVISKIIEEELEDYQVTVVEYDK